MLDKLNSKLQGKRNSVSLKCRPDGRIKIRCTNYKYGDNLILCASDADELIDLLKRAKSVLEAGFNKKGVHYYIR